MSNSSSQPSPEDPSRQPSSPEQGEAPPKGQSSASTEANPSPASELMGNLAKTTKNNLSQVLFALGEIQVKDRENLRRLVGQYVASVQDPTEQLKAALEAEDLFIRRDTVVNKTISPAVQIERDMMKEKQRAENFPTRPASFYNFPEDVEVGPIPPEFAEEFNIDAHDPPPRPK